MRVGTIYYNPNTDITEIKWADNFVVSDWVTRMDVLGDAETICSVAMDKVRKQETEEDNDGFLQGILYA